MIKFIELRDFIQKWQLENDMDFAIIPNDNQAALIFNHGNEIVKYIFSNEILRDKCIYSIPKELLELYKLCINQEDGYTYYYIK